MIYLDYSATTPVDERVLKVYEHATRTLIGNPNSSHRLGQEARKAIDHAIIEIRDSLKLSASTEIIFTSGASESNNLAIKGIAEKRSSFGKHIITSSFEHPSVTGPLNYLSRKGFEIDFVKTDKNGLIDLGHLESLIRPDTILVSICAVNGEIGTLQPIQNISMILKKHPHVCFHSDVTQAVGKYPINLELFDLASFSAHKVYGPKGIGILTRKNSWVLEPLIHGGHSTTVFRSGTPIPALILAFAEALKISLGHLEERFQYVQKINQYARSQLMGLSNLVFNSDLETCIPHILNVSLIGHLSGKTVLFLEKRDIFLSNHSACSSEEKLSSAVMALCHDEKRALSSFRISLSHQTSLAEVDALIHSLKAMVAL
jgi:cysteine desulfurase